MLSVRAGEAGRPPSAATGPTGRSGERLVGLTEKIYPNRDSDSDSRRRPPRASTCVVCEGESISNGSTHLGRVRGRVLALARPIGPQQLDGPAGRIDASSKGWMGLVKLLPRLVVKRPRPRDTLNDDDEFTTPSPRTFALRPAAAAREDLRRVARVSYQVWRTHMRACVAEYNFRGRVTESEPEPYLATTRPGRTKRFLLSFSHRPALLLSGPRGFFAQGSGASSRARGSWVALCRRQIQDSLSRTTGRAARRSAYSGYQSNPVVSRERGTARRGVFFLRSELGLAAVRY